MFSFSFLFCFLHFEFAIFMHEQEWWKIWKKVNLPSYLSLSCETTRWTLGDNRNTSLICFSREKITLLFIDRILEILNANAESDEGEQQVST